MTTGTYFKTNHPAALAQWENFQNAVNQWKTDVDTFTRKVGAQSAFGGIRWGEAEVQALDFAGEPPARWKREGHGHAPFKNNPINADFKALSREVLALDGIENMKMFKHTSGQTQMCSPAIFEHDGYLFLTYSDYETTIDTDVWEVIGKGDYLIAQGEWENR